MEVMALIGRGGMGEVYRARDTKLKRDVAIKILPDEFSRDADRVSRFQREAEVLALLIHPNIAAIYDLQEANGSRYLVLELIEGETLADRIARGPIPVEEALDIAKNICEALEVAHEKGIVHRDLKPANVKITADGKVKVLDFGLAKAFADDAQDVNLSNLPTLISMAATNAGVILGTAAYMSPEQAKGLRVDRRTDIFSFGVVLYEMLTGKQAFQGENVSDTLASVLRLEPDWTQLPADTPNAIRRLLRRSLQKDRSRRTQTAIDLLIELEEAKSDHETSDQRVAAVPSSHRLGWIAAAFFLLGTLALAVAAMVHFREVSPPAPEMRLEISTPSTSDPLSFALSPDGRQFVFVASGNGPSRLWLRALDATTAQPLAGTEGASFPFWSPDSKSVGFFAAGQLKRVDIGRGLPRTLSNAILGQGGTWNADGVMLFTPTPTATLFRVNASGGGEAAGITKLEPGQSSHRFPQLLPNGQFLFYATGAADKQGIYLGSLSSSETKRLTAADTPGMFLPPSWLFYIRQGTLVARRVDLARAALTGKPVIVADAVGSGRQASSGPTPGFSVSAEGLVAYRSGGVTNRRQLTWFDRSGKAVGTLGEADENFLQDFNLSPDGRRVVAERVVEGNIDIYLLDDTRMSRFTFDRASDTFPIWSADGSHIVFSSNRKGASNLYQKPSSGAATEEVLIESSENKFSEDQSPDGRFLLYFLANPPNADLWVLPLQGKRKPFSFLSTEFNERKAKFSPDGRWVAYQSNQSGREEVYIRPFPPGPGGQWQVSTEGDIWPRWRRDGKELYYIAPDARLMAVAITSNGDTLDPGKPVTLFQTRIVGGGSDFGRAAEYDVAPDGRFLINTVLENTTATPITLILNWKPPAK